jgi:hypothetical protein
MHEHEYSEQELKLTAAIYATQDWVVEIIRQTGKLPKEIPNGGFHIAMNVIIRQRGTDITLDEDEELVYQAILRERRLPGGGVRLVSQAPYP